MSDEKKELLSDDRLDDVSGGLSRLRIKTMPDCTVSNDAAGADPKGMTTWPPHLPTDNGLQRS